MFEDVPRAEAYSLKMIFTIGMTPSASRSCPTSGRRRPAAARVFIVEHVVPEHDVPHFSKLFDIHMMCWGAGKERTEGQYNGLLEDAGWKALGCYYPANRLIGVIVGACV